MNNIKLNNYFKTSPYLWDISIIIILFLTTVIINLQMIRYGLNGLGDIRWHITWVQHFAKQLAEGIWYPRWLAGTNFGYGSPTFVFYPPFVYYVGSLFRLIGLNSEQTMTALFSLPLFLSGVTFYIYSRSKWGKIPGTFGALFYMSCPAIISAINFGNLTNLWAYPWIPLGLYLTDRSLVKPKGRISLALFATIVALTHTPSLLIYTIAWFVYVLFRLSDKPFQEVMLTFIHGIMGLGIASFYLWPAIFEQKFVNLDYQFGSMGGFLMLQTSHLINNGWSDIVVKNIAALIIFVVISISICRREKTVITNTLLWLTFTVIVFFMISSWSEAIWQSSQTLLRIQRSGRLFGLFYLGVAALCALAIRAILQLNWKWRIFPFVLILSILLTNFHYGYGLTRQSPGLHLPTKGTVFIREWMEIALSDPDSDKLIDVPEYRPLLQNASYSPTVRETYKNFDQPYIEGGNAYFPVPKIGEAKISLISGEASVDIKEWKSYQRTFEIAATKPSTIRIRTYYYPAWHLYLNEQSYPLNMSEDGTINFEIQPGSYQVKLNYHLTKAFIQGIVLSIISLFSLIILDGLVLKEKI
jgi:hypothetical protein